MGDRDAVLDQSLYSIGEAARLLEIVPSRLRRWLDGARVRGTSYPPVIRPRPTGSGEVTWGEFAEAGLLREYRGRGVSLQHLRPFIERMRGLYGVAHPLAHFKPLVDRPTGQLMVELRRLQDAVGLSDDLSLVRVVSGQLVWAEPMRAFLDKVEFDPAGIGRRMYPLGRAEPVVIDPEVAFGIPQIRGVRTEIIGEAIAAGEPPSRIVAGYRVTAEEVMAALRWERRVQPRSRAA
ncbi:MAG TPA: DUF433 domain-containing protein [Candidatus Dormibacteraeota bacterium]